MWVVAAGLGAAACIGGSSAGGTLVVHETDGRSSPSTDAVRHAAGNDSVVLARFHNVDFRMWPGVALQLADLRGRMLSRRPDRVVSFDDRESFVLDVDSGSVSLAANDLANLMNTYVFAYKGAPLRDLRISIDASHITQRGVLHKVVDIPFEMVGDVSLTPDGEIRIHPVSMKICTIPGKGLMDALGINLAKLLDLRQAKGMRVAGNDLFIDPIKILPPPAIAGRVTSVELRSGAMIQHFARGPAQPALESLEPDSDAANYMLFRGGTLEFGKLFMVRADMQVIDESPSDAFDFDLVRYHDQLVAGYHRTLSDDGLLVFMPDAGKLRSRTASGDAAVHTTIH